jgi:excisionase family DNA binding protein
MARTEIDGAYTTGQIAKMCGVSIFTVTKWCSGGRIEYRLMPSSNHRRIDREDLQKFLNENGMAECIKLPKQG